MRPTQNAVTSSKIACGLLLLVGVMLALHASGFVVPAKILGGVLAVVGTGLFWRASRTALQRAIVIIVGVVAATAFALHIKDDLRSAVVSFIIVYLLSIHELFGLHRRCGRFRDRALRKNVANDCEFS